MNLWSWWNLIVMFNPYMALLYCRRWVHFGKDLELLDSPGILPMRISDQTAAIKLAICDDIGERSYGVADIASILVQMLARLPSVGIYHVFSERDKLLLVLSALFSSWLLLGLQAQRLLTNATRWMRMVTVVKRMNHLILASWMLLKACSSVLSNPSNHCEFSKLQICSEACSSLVQWGHTSSRISYSDGFSKREVWLDRAGEASQMILLRPGHLVVDQDRSGQAFIRVSLFDYSKIPNANIDIYMD